MKKITMLLALGATMALMPSVSKATIIGGTHDFTANGNARFAWGGATVTNADGTANASAYYNNPCQVCHIPHKAPAFATMNAPLWNHAKSLNASYVTYDAGGSTTFNQALKSTLGSSVACLSCHDGSVAINQSYGKTSPGKYGTATNAASYAPTFAVETATVTAGDFASASGAGPYLSRNDMTHMHPIGVLYDASIDQTLKPVTAGSTLSRMIKNGKVECASCHDIHGAIGNSDTVSHSLIVDLEAGALCTTCHTQ
jgi:hypothetical protein